MAKNRCGLGQTALNPIVSTIRNFPGLYEARVAVPDEGITPGFDLAAAVQDYEAAVARQP